MTTNITLDIMFQYSYDFFDNPGSAIIFGVFNFADNGFGSQTPTYNVLGTIGSSSNYGSQIYTSPADMASAVFSAASSNLVGYQNSNQTVFNITAGNLIYIDEPTQMAVNGKQNLNANLTSLSGLTLSANSLIQVNSGATGFTQVALPNTTPAISTFTPSLVGTGATGTQVSSSKASQVVGTFTTSTTVTLGGSPTSIVTGKICSTNSSTEANWTSAGVTGGSQPTTLAVTVGQQVGSTGQISLFVPAGWYYKFVNTGSGTHSESVASGINGQQIIYG